jgi:hypothetical protein
MSEDKQKKEPPKKPKPKPGEYIKEDRKPPKRK